MTLRFLSTLTLAALVSISSFASEKWIPLFNGKNLDGWTIKFAKHPLNENYKDTFVVEDETIKVSYRNWDAFDMQVAHLYTDLTYSHYRLRLDYKFVEGYREDAPFWVRLNSGVMLHSQTPQSLSLDQAFPVSIEAQFLATDSPAGKQTGNAATPGTHIELDGELTTDHIVEADSQFYPLDEWVHFEAEVRGHDEIVYFVNGKEVLRYQHPVLDETDKDAKRLLDAGAPHEIASGHIALQAEGQQVWFRNVEILPLTD